MVRYRRVLLVSLAAFATMGIAVANADAPTITGYPNQIKKVNLDGYVFQTSYSLGANTGFTFQQTYGPKTVSAHGVPDDGQRFIRNYVAMPVGNKMLMVTWYLEDGTIVDVFVMNFQTRRRFRCCPARGPTQWPEPAQPGDGEGSGAGREPDSSSVNRDLCSMVAAVAPLLAGRQLSSGQRDEACRDPQTASPRVAQATPTLSPSETTKRASGARSCHGAVQRSAEAAVDSPGAAA